MISIKTAVLIGIGCFILGELFMVICVALCSANKRHEAEDEIQQRRKKITNRSN